MPRPRSTAGAATQSRDRSTGGTLPVPRPRTDTNVTTQRRGSELVADDDSRRPGERTAASDQLREQYMRELARREFVMAGLRGHLAEQPNPRAVRACARRWISDINHLVDGVIAAMNTENEE